MNNCLTRTGQTEVIDKFWFYFLGLLHGTVKLSYQENMIWYGLVKLCMPPGAYHVIYKERHFVMSMSNIPGSNIYLDEGMEMEVIRHSKMLNTSVPHIQERSSGFLMLLGTPYDSLVRNLDPSRKRSTRNAELKPKSKTVRIRVAAKPIGAVRVDVERANAINVGALYAELVKKGWLADEHRGNEFLVNVLRACTYDQAAEAGRGKFNRRLC